MAESESGAEKSEEPTGKKITQARGEGQVGQSTDLSQVAGIVAAFLALQYFSPALWDDLLIVSKGSFSYDVAKNPLTVEALRSNFYSLIWIILPEILLIMITAGLAGALTTALQTKFLWSWKLLVPKFSKLNPVNGLKRLVGKQNIINLLKSIAKLCIICPLAYNAFFDLFPQLIELMKLPISDLMPFTAFAANHIFWRIISLLLVLAIFDVIWQKYNNHQQLKMTKEEVKDERKSVEGDEETKRAIQAKALQKARNRMFDAVPTADVVVTNPTHFAVALVYDQTRGKAPIVVAKGRGHVALRIRKLAKEHRVPVIERKPLARALYKLVEVGQQIPYEFYATVAELLAYIYKIKGKKIPRKAAARNTSGRVTAS